MAGTENRSYVKGGAAVLLYLLSALSTTLAEIWLLSLVAILLCMTGTIRPVYAQYLTECSIVFA